MLLSFSPEGSFVLILFELVLSGLSLVVLLWIQLREPNGNRRPAIRALSAGFALLVGAFAALALQYRLTAWPPIASELPSFSLLFASEVMRLLGAGALVTGCLLRRGRCPAVALVGGLTLGFAALAAVRFSSDAVASLGSIVPLTTGRVADAAVLLVGAAMLGPWSARPATALLLMAAGRAVAVAAAWWPEATESAWALEHLATLTGLSLFALTFERESRQTLLRVFLWLNVTFIVLASSLTVAITEIERRQFLEVSALQLEDLAEFARGHMLYYTARGESAQAALTHEDVVRKLVAEFGRYPDLRRVQVSLGGRTMALEINPRGEIAQWLSDVERARSPRVSVADFSVAPLLTVPILSAGRAIGRVELTHTLERINIRLGWQMQLIFAVCTVFVVVASTVTGRLVVATDRTIRRQYEELERTQHRLSLAERLASIGAVADGVAHELNNPAGILIARTDYLLATIQEASTHPEIQDDLETIRRQAQRIARTVKELLTFTRPMPLLRDVFDLHLVLESAVALVGPLAGGRVAIDCEFARAAPPVCGDRDHLEQVFTNLLTNAVQAIPGEGRVTLVTCARDGAVEVLVRDTGVGIAPEHLDRIFDPFFSTKKPGAGTGLGLSIAYGIIRDHGGSIDVSSTPGTGTEFRVILPPVVDPSQSARDDAAAVAEAQQEVAP